MKISAKAVQSFNQGKRPTFNDAYNRANGIHSMLEDAIMRATRISKYGVLNPRGRITKKDVDEFIETHASDVAAMVQAYQKNNWRDEHERIRHSVRKRRVLGVCDGKRMV